MSARRHREILRATLNAELVLLNKRLSNTGDEIEKLAGRVDTIITKLDALDVLDQLENGTEVITYPGPAKND